MKKILGSLPMLGLALAASAGPRLGQPAPDFTTTDISGQTVKLSDYKGKIVVLESFGWQSPRTRLEYTSGTAQWVQHRLATNGVVYLMIDSGLDQMTPAAARTAWTNRKMEITDWIIDGPGIPLTQLYGLKASGQMAVIDQKGALAYSGDRDDAPNLNTSPFHSKNHVLQAVQELLAGKQVSTPEVPVRPLAPDDSPAPQIGKPAPDFIATDIAGKMIKLSDYKGKIVVLESYTSEPCPFDQMQYVGGAMQELQKELTAAGVVWLLVDFESGGQIPEKARQLWAGQKMAVTDWIIDTDGSQIGLRFALKTTPEAVVVDQEGKLAYEGAVSLIAPLWDNSPEIQATLARPGHPINLPLPQLLAVRDRAILTLDPRETTNYVRDAVRALLAGKKVLVPETKPGGCPLQFYPRT